jgi:hypothetical protein
VADEVEQRGVRISLDITRPLESPEAIVAGDAGSPAFSS